MADIHAFTLRADLVGFLAAARIEQGVSQPDLGDVVGVHRDTIGRWERQEKDAGLSGLLAWAWALGFDVALVKR